MKGKMRNIDRYMEILHLSRLGYSIMSICVNGTERKGYYRFLKRYKNPEAIFVPKHLQKKAEGRVSGVKPSQEAKEAMKERKKTSTSEETSLEILPERKEIRVDDMLMDIESALLAGCLRAANNPSWAKIALEVLKLKKADWQEIGSKNTIQDFESIISATIEGGRNRKEKRNVN